MTLKSPGTKPTRRQNNSNSTSTFSNTLPFGSKSNHHFNASESEQSPTASTANHQSDFSVFAPVNIPISSSSSSTSFYSSSNTSHAAQSHDETISIISNAPELPRRLSTSIPPSHNNNNNNFNHNNHITADKPLPLSPRMHFPVSSVAAAAAIAASVSPGRILDSLNEDCRNMELHQEQASPSSTAYKPNPYQRAGIRNNHSQNITSITNEPGTSPGFHQQLPSSPRYSIDSTTEASNGYPIPPPPPPPPQHTFQQPISPHVNVPPNAQNFNHIPPPLPPRRPPKKNPHDFYHSQLRQNPDAPTLMPRDIDPPPLPPRTHSSHNNNNNNGNGMGQSNGTTTWNHQELLSHGQIHQMTLLTTPETSSIMQRRNSQLNRDNHSAASTPLAQQTPPILPSTSSYEAKNSPSSVSKKIK